MFGAKVPDSETKDASPASVRDTHSFQTSCGGYDDFILPCGHLGHAYMASDMGCK